jgi:endonuclease G
MTTKNKYRTSVSQHFIYSAFLSCSLSILLLCFSCSKDDSTNVIFSGVTLGKYESRLEVPKLAGGDNLFIQHSVKIGNDSVMTYCLEYNPVKNHSRWVAFRFDGLTRDLGSGRSDAWADDPKLPQKYRIGSGYFSGYSRGHICASYDRQYSKEANQQTFYMSNMSPMQYDFNGNYWTAFEQYVQSIGRDASFADTLYVVKGGTIDQTQGTVTSSGGKSIVIPRYYFMALLRFKAGDYSAIGFWVEHKDYGYSGNKYAPESVVRDKAVNIDELEKKTGIDFFHNLPNLKEDAIEGEDVETLKKLWF